jgi:hypothetical protein
MIDQSILDSKDLNYTIDIEDKPFRSFDKTVYVSFFDDIGKLVDKVKLGYISKETIYDWIEKKQELNLNNAYIKNFSLTEYRVERGLDDSVFIELNNFSSKKSFFDSDTKVDFSYSKFTGDKIIFEQSVFGHGHIDFSNSIFNADQVNFKKVKFGKGNKSFQFASFSKGDVLFGSTNFGSGAINFVNADFGHGNVDFKQAKFGDGLIDFKFAKFSEGDVNFERVVFGKGKKDFKNLEFGGGKIDFRRADFNDGDVIFEGVEFGEGKVLFRSALFGFGDKHFDFADFGKGDAQFDQVDFGGGSLSFKNAKAETLSFNGCAFNLFVDFRVEKCHQIDLSQTIIRDIMDFDPDDEQIHIDLLNIKGMRILGRLFIDWRKNKVKDLIYNQSETRIIDKAEQFRLLKENFRNNGQYEDEDFCYLEFKRCEAKGNLEEELNSTNVFKKYAAFSVYYFQKYVFDFIGRYATNPIRVLMNMVIVYSAFSFIYFFVSEYFTSFGYIATGLSEPELHSIHTAFYYSAITFFTIGYGDYFPHGGLKFIATFEGFCGVFLMSYFTVAFVRKILR